MELWFYFCFLLNYFPCIFYIIQLLCNLKISITQQNEIFYVSSDAFRKVDQNLPYSLPPDTTAFLRSCGCFFLVSSGFTRSSIFIWAAEIREL